MSKSIRVSDELLEQAKRTAKLFHRSPPQQIEHWAQIGRVMESTLSYGSQQKVAEWGSTNDIDELLDKVESPEGKARAQEVIRRTSGRIVSLDSDDKSNS